MEIRKAFAADIDAVERIYGLIHDEEEAGRATIGWARDVYPVRRTAEAALKRGDLWVMEDSDEIVASAIINHMQDPEYAKAQWSSDAAGDKVLVLHTLAVRPDRSGHGYGTRFVSFYERRARELGCTSLRMDTNARNASARRLYARLGYSERGIVDSTFNGIAGVRLVCLEKLL